MKVERISYSKIFPIASYINEKIGVDLLVDETDSPDKVYAEAKRLVEQFHANNPSLFEVVANERPIPIENINPQPTEPQPSMIEQINSCTDTKVLESYKLIARTNPEWYELYRNKLIELSPK